MCQCRGVLVLVGFCDFCYREGVGRGGGLVAICVVLFLFVFVVVLLTYDIIILLD